MIESNPDGLVAVGAEVLRERRQYPASVTITDAILALAEQPKVTDWMQGWGSLAGVLLSLVAVIVTGLLLRHEMREARRAREQAAQERAEAAEDRKQAHRDREFADQERRAAEAIQARTVVIGALIRAPAHKNGVQGVLVRTSLGNYGSGPITRVEVDLANTTDEQYPHHTVGIGRYDVLAPGAELEIETVIPSSVVSSNEILNESVPGTARPLWSVQVAFTDMNGRRWRRLHDREPGKPWGTFPRHQESEPR